MDTFDVLYLQKAFTDEKLNVLHSIIRHVSNFSCELFLYNQIQRRIISPLYQIFQVPIISVSSVSPVEK